MLVDWDSATIVRYGHGFIVFVKLNSDLCRVAVHGFVDRVVHNLPDQVMKSRRADATDIHAGAFANGLESFEYNNVVAVVAFLFCHD